MMNNPSVRTLQDLAQLLGLSKSTVSRALNGNPVIAEETRRRVAEVAQQYRFAKNVSAQRLTTKSSRMVGFVVHSDDCCGPSDLFSLEIQGGISQGLHDLDYSLLVMPVDFQDPTWVRRLLDSRQVDGFVLMSSTRKAGYLKALVEGGAPFVTWGPAPGTGAEFPTVCTDDHSGGRQVGALAATYVGPYAVVAGPREEPESLARLAGFREGLADQGASFDDRYLRFGDYSQESGSLLAQELLGLDPPPRVIFAQGDWMAIGVMKQARALGLSIPGDLAVIGFDDLMVAQVAEPALTTVAQHINQAGRALAQVLVRHLETGVVDHVVMPVELVRRASA